MARRNLATRQEVKNAVNNYYEKDMSIFIDDTVFGITAIPFYLAQHIFFGNVILYSSELLDKLDDISQIGYIQKRNVEIFKREIMNQKYQDYVVVNCSNEFFEILKFLKNKKDYVFLTADKYRANKAYEEAVNTTYLGKGFVELNCYQKGFETVGAIQWKNQIPYIKCIDNTSKIYVFDKNFKEKEIPNEGVKVDVNDYIMIVKTLSDIKTVIIYQLFSMHSRHHARRIFWTDISNTEYTNCFIEMQDEMLKILIKQKISNN